MENLNKTIERIINIPIDFHKGGVSLLNLVKNSGYYDVFNSVTEESLIIALKKNPRYIQDWLQWSDDKRARGWIFRKADNGEFSIKNNSGENYREEVWFTDEFTACADYIKKEAEWVRITFAI